jgi:hypothetical protein
VKNAILSFMFETLRMRRPDAWPPSLWAGCYARPSGVQVPTYQDTAWRAAHRLRSSGDVPLAASLRRAAPAVDNPAVAQTRPERPMADAARDETLPSGDALESERWHFERDLRLRELALKEREQANRDADIDLRRGDLRNATWRSPLTVAVFAAAVAGGGNAIVAWVNGWQQRDLENTRRASEEALEKSKAESSRILEMIKTGDSEKAAGNLMFLLESGLITDKTIQEKLSAYLSRRAPGTGPALPSLGNSRIGFDEGTPAERPLQEQLQARLNNFLPYLDRIGFPPSTQKVQVHLEAGIGNAYYDGHRIVIDERLVDDPSVALREYGQYLLASGHESTSWMGQYAAIESALADYFACSFLNDARVGAKLALVLKFDKPQIRNLDNARNFAEFKAMANDRMPYDGAEIWGGMFWELRARLGREAADRLLASTWQQFEMPPGEAARAPAFARRLADQAARQGGAAQRQAVVAVLRERGFPVGG